MDIMTIIPLPEAAKLLALETSQLSAPIKDGALPVIRIVGVGTGVTREDLEVFRHSARYQALRQHHDVVASQDGAAFTDKLDHAESVARCFASASKQLAADPEQSALTGAARIRALFERAAEELIQRSGLED